MLPLAANATTFPPKADHVAVCPRCPLEYPAISVTSLPPTLRVAMWADDQENSADYALYDAYREAEGKKIICHKNQAGGPIRDSIFSVRRDRSKGM